MQMSVHKMFLCRNSTELKAVCSVTLNNEFNINNVRVVDTNTKLLVVMPGKIGRNGKFYDLVHPIKDEIRKQLEQVVLDEYKHMTTGGKTNE